jgi:hypothetical protein
MLTIQRRCLVHAIIIYSTLKYIHESEVHRARQHVRKHKSVHYIEAGIEK